MNQPPSGGFFMSRIFGLKLRYDHRAKTNPIGASMNANLSRRAFGKLGSALLGGACFSRPGFAQTQMPKPFVADMHSHYGQFLPRLFGLDLQQHMRDNGIMLLAWSVVDDQKWIATVSGRLTQTATPKPGELWDYFNARMVDYENRLRQWNVTKAFTAADIDAALAGQPRLLLATESANFLEGQIDRLSKAHAMGVRHLQLVHYIRSPLGDHQTAEPLHGGLTALGAQVVAECKRLGMVVDLAHGTPDLVDGALAASDAAMVWSHSWVTPSGAGHQSPTYIARSLALPTARKIAARGGAVGLWSLRLQNDPSYPANSIASYADEIMRMCDLLGPAHVAFGTDMEGVWPGRLMTSYADLAEVANNLQRRGLSDSVLHGILIGNYARIVKQAMMSAKA
jgi:membrane dipeptidase